MHEFQGFRKSRKFQILALKNISRVRQDDRHSVELRSKDLKSGFFRKRHKKFFQRKILKAEAGKCANSLHKILLTKNLFYGMS